MLTLADAAPIIQSGGTDWISTFAQFGLGGLVIAWFMFRSEPRLRAIEAAIDRGTRGIVVISIAIANALEALKWHGAQSIRLQAEPIERELDEAEKQRRGSE